LGTNGPSRSTKGRLHVVEGLQVKIPRLVADLEADAADQTGRIGRRKEKTLVDIANEAGRNLGSCQGSEMLGGFKGSRRYRGKRNCSCARTAYRGPPVGDNT